MSRRRSGKPAKASLNMTPNPAWADRAVERAWDGLSQVFGEEAMPTQLAQFERGQRSWQETGCGGWGCVYHTGIPGVIFKVTHDVSEAMFAAHALRLGSWPDGMVRYWSVYQEAPGGEGERSFFLWREEVFDIDATADKFDRTTSWMLLRDLMGVAREYFYPGLAVAWSFGLAEEFLASVVELRSFARKEMGGRRGRGMFSLPLHLYDKKQKAAIALVECERIADLVARQREPDYPAIGEAVLYYLAHGMLLADVRPGNLGVVVRERERSLVIFDPGAMLPTKPALLRASLPMVGEPDKHAVLQWKRLDDHG